MCPCHFSTLTPCEEHQRMLIFSKKQQSEHTVMAESVGHFPSAPEFLALLIISVKKYSPNSYYYFYSIYSINKAM